MDILSLSPVNKPEAFIQGWASFFDGFNEQDVEKFYPRSSEDATHWINGLRGAIKANSPKEFNPHVINCRTSLNGIAHPWEPMFDINPPTITKLIDFLKQHDIDPSGLSLDSKAYPGGQTLKYGINQQFWLPNEATPDELKLLKDWKTIPNNIQCPKCESTINIISRMNSGMEIYYASCRVCDIEITKCSAPALSPTMLTNLLT